MNKPIRILYVSLTACMTASNLVSAPVSSASSWSKQAQIALVAGATAFLGGLGVNTKLNPHHDKKDLLSKIRFKVSAPVYGLAQLVRSGALCARSIAIGSAIATVTLVDYVIDPNVTAIAYGLTAAGAAGGITKLLM